MLIGYEWLEGGRDRTPRGPRTRKTEAVLASRAELLGLFEHPERELDAAQFFFPPAKKQAMVRNMRAMILRVHISTDQGSA